MRSNMSYKHLPPMKTFTAIVACERFLGKANMITQMLPQIILSSEDAVANLQILLKLAISWRVLCVVWKC